MAVLRAVKDHVLLSPVIQALSAVLTAGTVAMAARQQQLPDIAAYSAGLGIAAFLGVVIGGGTALVFVTGTDEDRHAVAVVRWTVVAPAMTLLVLISAAAYHFAAPALSTLSVLLGGLTVIINNLAGLDAASLQRQRRMLAWGTSTLAGRLLAFAMVFVGGTYSMAVTVGALVTLLGNIALVSWHRDERPAYSRRPSLDLVVRAFRPSFAAMSVLDVVLLRVPFVLAPTIASAAAAGAFATLLSAQQSVAALLTGGLYTIMTVRGSSNAVTEHRRSERLLELGSLPVAAVGLVGAGLCVSLLGIQNVPQATLFWMLFMLALPMIVFNRGHQYRLLTQGDSPAALRLLSAICAGVLALSLVAALHRDIGILAWATLSGEVCGLALWTFSRLRTSSNPVQGANL